MQKSQAKKSNKFTSKTIASVNATKNPRGFSQSNGNLKFDSETKSKFNAHRLLILSHTLAYQ